MFAGQRVVLLPRGDKTCLSVGYCSRGSDSGDPLTVLQHTHRKYTCVRSRRNLWPCGLSDSEKNALVLQQDKGRRGSVLWQAVFEALLSGSGCTFDTT